MVGEGHALHLDVGGPRVSAFSFQHEIETTTALTFDLDRHLGTHHGVARELRDRPVLEREPRDLVGALRVEPHPDAPHPDHLESVAQLALGVRAAGAAHRGAGPRAAQHAARVRAVHGVDAALPVLDVGEEALVAPQQRACEVGARIDG